MVRARNRSSIATRYATAARRRSLCNGAGIARSSSTLARLDGRPWADWILQRRFKQRPPGELGELRAISQLCLYRDAAEVEYVERRLRELGRQRNAARRMVDEDLRVA